MPAQDWANIAAYVHDVVARSESLVSYSKEQLYPAVTRLVEYAFTAGMPLQDEYVFDPFTVDEFAHHRLGGYNRASRNTMRARVRRVSEVLLGEDAQGTYRALGKANAVRPYPNEDLTGFHAWAAHQPTVESRTSALVLLALGTGAGLTGAEIVAARVEHFRPNDGGFVIDVLGRNQRSVPLLAGWESAVRARFEYLEGTGWAFRREQRGNNVNLITDFVSRAGGADLQSRRMRATWIVHHLRHNTPLSTLLRIAGLRSAETLDRYMPFLDDS